MKLRSTMTSKPASEDWPPSECAAGGLSALEGAPVRWVSSRSRVIVPDRLEDGHVRWPRHWPAAVLQWRNNVSRLRLACRLWPSEKPARRELHNRA
jgi:hypothetical protein